MRTVKFDPRTLDALTGIVTGDTKYAPQRTGPQLVNLFNFFSDNKDIYGSGFPTRSVYAREKLNQLNGTAQMRNLINHIFDAREWITHDGPVEDAVNHLNQFFQHDGYQLIKAGAHYKIIERNSSRRIKFDASPLDVFSDDHEFIEEQVAKCNAKLEEGDYDGAISNARTLVEAVLGDLEKQLTGQISNHGGDLLKANKEAIKLLNLDPGQPDIGQELSQVLRGLISIVQGISAIRNKSSDAHTRKIRPSQHHALLVVNSATTYSNFIYDSYQYQLDRGLIKPSSPRST